MRGFLRGARAENAVLRIQDARDGLMVADPQILLQIGDGGHLGLAVGDQRGRGLGLLALVLEGHDEGLQALAQVFESHFVVDALAVDAKALHGGPFRFRHLPISRGEIPTG